MPALRARAALVTSPVLVLAALFAITLPLVTARIYASDEVQYFAWLRSLWFDRDVSFENEYQHFYDAGIVRYPGFHETFLERQTETGRRITFATMGSAVLWSPFYAVADVSVRVRRALGADVAADGYSAPYVAAVAYGSAVYGWLSLVVSLAIVRRVFNDSDPRVIDRAALGAIVAMWIGSPLFFYMYIAPPMSHACSAFAVSVFVLAWLRVRERWSLGGMVVLGALAALMAMVREQDLFVAIGPAIDWLWTTARSRERVRLSISAIAGALAFGVAYAPQLAAYVVLNGYPGPSRLVARKMNWVAPYALGVLASPEHGLLFWTPLVALSLVGLVLLARHLESDRVRIGLCALVIVASQVYVAGSVESWTVAGAFGQRRFVGLTAIFVLGLSALWLSMVRQPVRRVVLAVGAVAIWWNLGLMAQFGAGLMDRQRLELGRNAYHTFVTIPRRLPELVHRYVFARRTFYQKAGGA
jgi:hypothetical protein